MRRLTFTLLIFLGTIQGFSREEFVWIYTWHAWLSYIAHEDWEAYLNTYGHSERGMEIIIPIPLLTEEYPRAAAQLDKLVKDAMKNHHSLDWALDYLKPSLGPAASVPDSLRRMMLYYIYHDNFSRLNRPWCYKESIHIDWFFSAGTGTYDRGWVRYAYINTGPGEDAAELWFYGYCAIAWARTDNAIMDSARAVRMFNKAAEKNMLVSRLSKPIWSPILSVQPVGFHYDYKIPAVQLAVPVEYDCCEVYPEVFRRPDTLIVTVLVKNGYEYLFSYSNSDSKGDNFSNFLQEEIVFQP
ncbi:hypothetical protein CEE36_05165 [candidate division TA06 bacterium B3_TA06]|uniref:Uncharacterized protein n=1 Tax=candidate division TA06 bacterium B3_TA06 TaxID=2012487 RepID=A0A532V7H0_UNCT6|nr:MAG: hypothetical protein CEE36_05165 [candidate division TA06 bacterium B3_TA06]